MRKIVVSLLSILTFCVSASAQCPSSSRAGVHVVQPGQTLYRLAKIYGTSVRDIASFNGITEATSIPVCTEIKIPNGVTFYERGAEDNRITQTNPVAQPQPYQPQPYQPSYESKRTSFAQRLASSNGTHITNDGETIESIARYYGYTIERMREMNSLEPDFQVRKGTILVVSECFFEEGTRTTNRETTIMPQTSRPVPPTNPVTPTSKPPTITPPATPPTTTNPPQTNTGGKAPKKAAASYMKAEELTMIDEVNLVRSNPAGYIPYIEAYKLRIAKGEAFGSEATCDELIAELRNLSPLSVLQPLDCLYDAAKKHGEDGRARGSNDHVGSDQSWPWDRVLRSCPNLTDGNENLVGGPASVRDAVTILLIDDGIPNRGHRRTMLDPKWTYLACYKIGMVGNMPNSWVQKYGH